MTTVRAQLGDYKGRKKYVTKRDGKWGRRFYWQRPGFPLVRLPDDAEERARMVAELNGKAERGEIAPTRSDFASTGTKQQDRADYRQMQAALAKVRTSARGRGIRCDLTVYDLADLYERAGGRCEVSGVPFNSAPVIVSNGKRTYPYIPSVDRIRNGEPYTRDNVRLVCQAVNYAMRHWGEEVLHDIAIFMAAKGKSPTG